MKLKMFGLGCSFHTNLQDQTFTLDKIFPCPNPKFNSRKKKLHPNYVQFEHLNEMEFFQDKLVMHLTNEGITVSTPVRDSEKSCHSSF